jgi:hypothetical protein
MPTEWALADSAIRLSVVCLVKIWNKVEAENPSFWLGKHLGISPIEYYGIFSNSSSCYNFCTTYEVTTSLYTDVLARATSL